MWPSKVATKRLYGCGSARLGPSTSPLSPAGVRFSVATKVVCCGLCTRVCHEGDGYDQANTCFAELPRD